MNKIAEITERSETLPSGTIVYRKQTAVINGVNFERSSQKRLGEGPDEYDLENQHFVRSGMKDAPWSDQSPDIACGDCLGVSFTLLIRGYSVNAKCTNCGKTSEVYSG